MKQSAPDVSIFYLALIGQKVTVPSIKSQEYSNAIGATSATLIAV